MRVLLYHALHKEIMKKETTYKVFSKQHVRSSQNQTIDDYMCKLSCCAYVDILQNNPSLVLKIKY